jgi:hypothetical protein
MGRILLVALAFVILLHLFQTAATRRTGGLKVQAHSEQAHVCARSVEMYTICRIKAILDCFCFGLPKQFVPAATPNESPLKLPAVEPEKEPSAVHSNPNGAPPHLASASDRLWPAGLQAKGALRDLHWNLFEMCLSVSHGRRFNGCVHRSSLQGIRGKSL